MLGDSRSTKKMAPHLSDPRCLSKCDALSCEGAGKTVQTSPRKNTVKLGYYVHGLVRTLGYNVLSVDHEHRQSENMYIFFRIRRTERGTKSDITYQFSLQEHFFALSLALFSDHEHVHCLSVLISTSRHVFKFTMPRKAISPYEKRVMNDIQNGEASSVADFFFCQYIFYKDGQIANRS